MTTAFKPFEERIDNVYKRYPGEGKQQVLLSRLYAHGYKALETEFNGILEQFGLNVSNWVALICIYSDPENAANPSLISDALVLSRTNITRVADELEDKGWLKRDNCPDDRRKIRLSLTPAGVEFVERIIPTIREHTARIWSVLDKQEQATLEHLLRKILARVGS